MIRAFGRMGEASDPLEELGFTHLHLGGRAAADTSSLSAVSHRGPRPTSLSGVGRRAAAALSQINA